VTPELRVCVLDLHTWSTGCHGIYIAGPKTKLCGHCSKRQHVPLDTYSELLQTTVKHLRACKAEAIVIITPPPVDEPARIVFRKQAGQPCMVAACRVFVLGHCDLCSILTLWLQYTDSVGEYTDLSVIAMQKWGINELSEQPDRLNAVTGQYAAACRQVAADEGVPVLDLWTGGFMVKCFTALCSHATQLRRPDSHAKHRPPAL
jgi:hypothetical protein